MKADLTSSPGERTRWNVLIDRADLTRTEVVTEELPTLANGEVLLRVDRIGLTANNVTYALYGDIAGFLNHFPAPAGRGVVPAWGFADVVESMVDEHPVGQRIYGFLPTSSHLVVRPATDPAGFADVSEHRRNLPGSYNRYLTTIGDPAYRQGNEDLQMLYRPLFYASFLLADQLEEHDCYDAEQIVLSSASSNTALGTALRLHDQGKYVIGLTSPRNVGFTTSLGCYNTTLPYHAIANLPLTPTTYLDFSGAAEVRSALYDRLGSLLVKDIAIGLTHQHIAFDPRSELFFVPNRVQQRVRDWGPAELANRSAQACQGLIAEAAKRVTVVPHHGPDGVAEVWRMLVSGTTRPDQAHTVHF